MRQQAKARGDELHIRNPVDLRRRVRITGTGPLEDEAVRNAERALAELSASFKDWMHSEIEKLLAARDAIPQDGLDAETRDRLFHIAHDLKGEAATLGFPYCGRMAGSLARLLEQAPVLGNIPLPLVLHHIDAMRAAVVEKSEILRESVAQALAEELEGRVERFLADEFGGLEGAEGQA
jgi:HPt (histidine-containing phosphotransfer) domain-containing protein